MSTISFRYNDDKKQLAEKISGSLGLSLTNVLTVMLNKFVSEKGFPFELKVEEKDLPLFDGFELEKLVQQAVKEHDKSLTIPTSAYLDSDGVFHPSKQR